MASKKGDWAKVTGGDHGAVFDGHKWIGFDCLLCAVVDGVVQYEKRRQLGEVATYVYKALVRDGRHTCGGAEKHKVFFQRKAAGEFGR